jgi:hypothetical protein
MSEQTSEPTTATDLESGEDKPGTDYGSPGEETDGNGAAVPDDPSAEAAQEGVQTAFSVDP